MSIRLLRTCITIADQGSFSAAANTASVTRGAVSQQLRALEEAWQVTIFVRSHKTAHFSPIGITLFAKAREVVSSYDNIVPAVPSNDQLQGGFRLAAAPAALTGLVLFATALLKDRYPELQIKLHPGLSTHPIHRVERHLLRAAFAPRPEILPRKLDWRPLACEEMLPITSQKITMKDPADILRRCGFIRFSHEAIVDNIIEKRLQENNIPVADNLMLGGLDAICSLVLADLGISITPQPRVRRRAPAAPYITREEPGSAARIGSGATQEQHNDACGCRIDAGARLRRKRRHLLH